MREPQLIDDAEHERVFERVAAVDVAKAAGVVCTRTPHGRCWRCSPPPAWPRPRRLQQDVPPSSPRLAMRSADLAYQHGRVAAGCFERWEIAAACNRIHGDNMGVVTQVTGVDDMQPTVVKLEDGDRAAF